MAVAARMLVLCPLRRELRLALFTGARKSFLRLGFPAASIRRAQGADLAQATSRDRVPRPCMVVTRALLRDFVPAARAIFAQTPGVRYVWFAEDDCRVKRGVSLEAIVEACRVACGLREIAWLGFRKSGGEPKIGAQLLSFSRSALARFPKTFRPFPPRRCGGRLLRHSRIGYFVARLLVGWACVEPEELHGHAGGSCVEGPPLSG